MTIERLSVDDRLLLRIDRAWPQDVGVVAILDGRRTLPAEAAMEAVGNGLPAVPRLRQVLRVPAWGLGGPFWVDAPCFDLAEHVRQGPRLRSREDADLLAAVEQIRRHPLDPRRPLWELWLLPGPDGGLRGIFIRMHHVVADGVAGVARLAALLDHGTDERAQAQPAWTPGPGPRNRELLADHLRRRVQALGRGSWHIRAGLSTMAQAWQATRQLGAGEPGPKTSLGGLVGPARRIDVVRAPLAEMKAVARANGGTVNDVLLTVIGGGVRALLISRGESVHGLVLPILVPVSLRRAGDDAGMGNRISQTAVLIPVGEADPVERLRRVTVATSRAKATGHPSMGTVFRNPIVSAIVLRRIVRKRVNLLSADIVGPVQPLSLAGDTLLEMFPLINLVGNVTLGVGALSYAGSLNILAVADADIYPDLSVFAAAAAADISTLVGTSTTRAHQTV